MRRTARLFLVSMTFIPFTASFAADPEPVIIRHDPAVPVSFGVDLNDIEAIFPEMIWINGNTLEQGVNYISFIAPLLEAVKQLSVQNDDLRAELEALKQAGSSVLVPPASADEPCTAGVHRVDEHFLYVCMSAGTWRRWPMQTW